MEANQDNDADIFDPFLSLVRTSKHFDEEDIAVVEETRREHQKHVETRIQMDKTLRETKQFLVGRMQKLQEFESNVPANVKSTPAYKHFFDTFAQKQVQIQEKYKELREKREAIYGKYTTPSPSPHHSPSKSLELELDVGLPEDGIDGITGSTALSNVSNGSPNGSNGSLNGSE